MGITGITLEDLKRELWDGKYKEESYCFNDKGIEAAIKCALADFTDRTEKLNPKYENEFKNGFGVDAKFEKLQEKKASEKSEKDSEKSFVDLFEDYFKLEPCQNQETFDDWHKKTCNLFLEVLGKYYDALSYGKAQKIVNMTFKYAYCLPNVSDKKTTRLIIHIVTCRWTPLHWNGFDGRKNY